MMFLEPNPTLKKKKKKAYINKKYGLLQINKYHSITLLDIHRSRWHIFTAGVKGFQIPC